MRLNWNRVENKSISLNDEPTTRYSHYTLYIIHYTLCKFLVVFNFDKLKFDKYIIVLVSKVSLSIGVMKCVSNLVSAKILRKLHFTLIYSSITYAIPAWGTTLNSTIRRLESLNSKAISLIKDYSNTKRLLISLKLIWLKCVYEYFVPCKLLRNICKRKHGDFTQKIERSLILKGQEIWFRAYPYSVLYRLLKSKTKSALVFYSK